MGIYLPKIIIVINNNTEDFKFSNNIALRANDVVDISKNVDIM